LCQKLDLLLSSGVRDEQKPIVFGPEALCETSIIIEGQVLADIRQLKWKESDSFTGTDRSLN
jgi:hypothetical protein